NQVFIPESTLKTVEELRNTNLPLTGMALDYKGMYRREVFAGYGHMDCIVGDKAYKEVYPVLLDFLESNLKSTGYNAATSVVREE
ncbi:hypothetical protein BGW38_009943, partial [Lunasporangiospora selenospora]